MAYAPVEAPSREVPIRVLFDARLAVRGLGIASAADRLVAALRKDPLIELSVNASSRGWTRRGKWETVAISGLLDVSTRVDPRTWGMNAVHYFGNTAPQYPSAATVVTVHDIMMMRGSTLKSRIFTSLLIPGLRRAGRTQVVAISRQTADDLIAVLPEIGKRITVIPHGRRPGRFSKRERSHILMFGGMRDARKRVWLGLHAYSEYAERTGANALPLILVGRAGVDERVKEYTRSGSLIVESNPGNERMDELLASAACVIYPSIEEGFGLPILEAGEVGTPVICDTSARIPTELMGDHVYGVNGSDPRDWSRAIARAVAGGPIDNALSCMPTWPEVASEYANIYRAVEVGR